MLSEGQVPDANDRIGVGFIGAGGRAHAHLQAVHWLKTQAKKPVEIVAVSDLFRGRMQRAAEAYAAKGYTDHRELLADPNVNVVCIATPDHHHGYQALDAVKAGKDVYCEKPVTHWRQFELTKCLAEEVKQTKRVFQLGTQGMSDSAWRQIKKLVQDGLIGQPIHAECGFFRVGDWGERGMPIDDPNAKPGADLNWEAFLGDAPKRPFDVSRFFRWRMYEDYAGGPVTDLFPHVLTPVVSMLGVKLPSLVVATGGMFRYTEREVPDTFNMLIDYPEKLTIAVLGTQGNNYQGTASVRGSAQRIPVLRGWEGTLTVQGKEIVFIPAEGSKKEAQRFPIEHDENLVNHWDNFLDCCRKREPQTWSPADLAYYVQTALIMGMLSFRHRKAIQFDAAQQKLIV
jgi:predicted dehydrogenase